MIANIPLPIPSLHYLCGRSIAEIIHTCGPSPVPFGSVVMVQCECLRCLALSWTTRTAYDFGTDHAASAVCLVLLWSQQWPMVMTFCNLVRVCRGLCPCPGASSPSERSDVPRPLVNLCLCVIHRERDSTICEHYVLLFCSIML